ncbi:MAG: NAD(P)(+) transhydrogenase (Re/Si-specific) subunit alpha, partial [Opitutae bacterium]|nr:NAD(P)(+) transhydrogenase (Re/Si-specific) subunit alpha [Opitutae bacterium]
MKTVFVPRETAENETRTALIPQDAATLVRTGFEITVESGTGLKAGFTDAAYEKAGAKVVPAAKAAAALAAADIVLRVQKPDNAKGLKSGALHVSYMDPFNEKELLNEF